MDRKDSYNLKREFEAADEADQRKLYASALEDYNNVVQITEAFIRMTRGFPNY